MSTINLKGFIAFAQEQQDSHVNNTSWHTCAIGDYLAVHDIEVGKGTGELPDLVPLEVHTEVWEFDQELRQQLTNVYGDEDKQSLHEFLNSGGFDTYGDIVAALVGET